MPAPVLSVPKADLPSYKPLVVPPSDLRPPPGIKGEGSEKEPTESKTNIPKEAQIVEIPFTDIEVPMPTTTIMTTAATTAFVSVAATLTATSLFKYIVMILKPVFKKTWSKLTKKKKPILKQLKEHHEELEFLATFVRLGVVVWSGFIITLNYVDLPMIKKGQSGGDITFVASVFTGALATFGLNTSNTVETNLTTTRKKNHEKTTSTPDLCSVSCLFTGCYA